MQPARPPSKTINIPPHMVTTTSHPGSGNAVMDLPRTTWQFKLLYDGDCPLCRREAQFLQRRNRHGRLAFEDIAAHDFDPAAYGATREQLMGVIHGVFPDSRLVRKMAVFREAYRAVGLGWVLAPTGWPGLRWLADRGYEWFARNRMTIGHWLGRRCDSSACRPSPPTLSA